MNVSGADLNLFVVFEAMLEEHSVSRAARRVGLSQPATSNALARLRVMFDDPLFVRRGSSMLPTPRAQQVAPHVRAGVGHLSAALGPGEGFDPATAERTFVIAAHDFAALTVLPALMERMHVEAPGVRVRVVKMGPEQPFVALERGTLDLVLGAAAGLPRGITSETLAEVDYAVGVRAEHPRVHRRLTLRQYLELDHLLVAPFGGTQGAVDRALHAHGHRRRIALTVPDFLLAPHIIARTDMVVTLPRKVFELVPGVGLRVFEPPVPVVGAPYACIWDERKNDEPAHEWLRSVVRRSVEA